MTNKEKLMNLSDAELADMLNSSFCPVNSIKECKYKDADTTCCECLEEWLKEESEV